MVKNVFIFCFSLFFFACSKPNTDLETTEIRLINRNTEMEIIDKLSNLQNEKDTSKRLEIEYAFYKKNINSLKSGLLQIDNSAFFQLFINDKLVLERKNGTFFKDTLMASKRDSFLYSKNFLSAYFIDSTKLKNSLYSGKNVLILKFLNPKYYKLDCSETELFLSTGNNGFPNNTPKKKLKNSALPWLSISAQNGIKDEPKSPATLFIKEGEKTTAETIQIEIRGNTSQSFKKKSYSFKVFSDDGNLKKAELLNLPKHEHWILYGPYADKSLMRNVLAYNLWEQLGYYAPRTKFCELSINGFYQGVYVLCEKIKVDTARLDLGSGYLLKIDRPKGAFFQSNISNGRTPKTVFEIAFPNKSSLTFSQKNQLHSFVHLFEESLFLSNENSLDIFEIIDMNSFVDFLIINELCKNIDAYRLSTYFQITAEKKIKMGPVWDFNFSLGLTDYLDGYATSGFVYQKMEEVPFWWKKLTQNIYFKTALQNRWRELRSSVLSEDSITKIISFYSSELNVAEKNNFEKWHLLGQKEVWPNYYIGKSHSDEIDYLQNWILERVQWLDKQWKIN